MYARAQQAMALGKQLADYCFQIVLNDLVFDRETTQGIEVIQPRHGLVAFDRGEGELLVEHMNVPHETQLGEEVDQRGSRLANSSSRMNIPSRVSAGCSIAVSGITCDCASTGDTGPVDVGARGQELLAQQTMLAVGSGGVWRLGFQKAPEQRLDLIGAQPPQTDPGQLQGIDQHLLYLGDLVAHGGKPLPDVGWPGPPPEETVAVGRWWP